MKKQHIFNLIILDESGSMGSIRKATLSGFNELVQSIKGIEKLYPDQEHFITFISFNTLGIKTHLFNAPVHKLNQLSNKSYQPDAGTPLYDAMGFGLNKQKASLEKYPDAHVLVTVLTDGEENASREFHGHTIRKMIEELKQQNWTFTYMGANHDVEKFSFSLSIDNHISFMANDEDVKEMFVKENQARARYSDRVHKNEEAGSGYYDEGTE